ncbi:hypothetical protein HY491_01440 [Candidatus Woesearchaeota archaeon]|nr:hypothetical protein [Candidatus Woesearchaeota archaeon]
MKPLIAMLRELRGEIRKIIVLDSLIDAVILFLACYIILVLLHIYPLLAIIPGGAAYYFIYQRKRTLASLTDVERRNPQLQEMLRTAADNLNEDNTMVNALGQEVMERMRRVASSSFMDIRQLFIKLAAISALFIVAIYFVSANIQVLSYDNLIKGINYLPKKMLGDKEGLFGDESLATLSQEKVTIELDPLSYEINLDKVQPAPEKAFREQFPSEVVARGARAFEENIPKDQQEIVKNYFEQINAR